MEAVLFLLLCCITSASSQVEPKCYVGADKNKLVLEQCEEPFTACQVYKKVWSCGVSPPASRLNATCDGDAKCWCITDECNKPYLEEKVGPKCYTGGLGDKNNLTLEQCNNRSTACEVRNGVGSCSMSPGQSKLNASCDGTGSNVCWCTADECNKPEEKALHCYEGNRSNKYNLTQKTGCKACWVGYGQWECREQCEAGAYQEKCDMDNAYNVIYGWTEAFRYDCCCKSDLCNKPKRTTGTQCYVSRDNKKGGYKHMKEYCADDAQWCWASGMGDNERSCGGEGFEDYQHDKCEGGPDGPFCSCKTDLCNPAPPDPTHRFYCYEGSERYNKRNLRRQTACKACWVGDGQWQCRQSCYNDEVEQKCDKDPSDTPNFCCCKSNLCNQPGNYTQPQDKDPEEGQGPTQGLPTVLPQATTLLAGVLAFLAKATF